MAASGLPALGGLDGVELKLNFDADQIDNALRVFGFDPDAGSSRRIWFGEVVDGLGGRDALPLFGRGIILRVRAKKKRGDDVTVKLRGPDGGIDVARWRNSAGKSDDAKIEGDWASKRLVSASLSTKFDDDVPPGTAPPEINDLLTKEQKDLADQMLIPRDRVTLLGPISATKWDAVDGVEAERWTLDGQDSLEISAYVTEDPAEAMQQLRQRAEQGGLKFAAAQETKTAEFLKLLATRQ